VLGMKYKKKIIVNKIIVGVVILLAMVIVLPSNTTNIYAIKTTIQGIGNRSVLNTLDEGWNVEYVGSCDTPGYSMDIFIDKNYAYIADGTSGGLQIIDVSNPEYPYIVGNCEIPGKATGVFVRSDYAYVAASYTGLQIVDITDITNPFIVGSCDTPHIAKNVFVQGDFAYIADEESGLQIINISNPENPFIVGNSTLHNVMDADIQERYGYVAYYYGGLKTIDISDPKNMVVVGSCDLPGNTYSIMLKDKYAYLACEQYGLQVVDISTPANPYVTGKCTDFHHAQDIYILGDYAYIANRDNGICVVNITDPKNPVFVGEYDTPGDAQGISAQGLYIYVADWNEGLQIYQYIKNIPPAPPEINGPNAGCVGFNYTFYARSTDPNNHKIKYGWDWDGDGNIDNWTDYYVESGKRTGINHSWSKTGIYEIQAIAEDENGLQSSFSPTFTIKITYNSPPQPPVISGPTSGETGYLYTFNVSTIDPDGDDVFYIFDWDDGTNSSWIGPLRSGYICSASHKWSFDGKYVLRVKAKDINGYESGWTPYVVTMPKKKIDAPRISFINFLQHFFYLLTLNYLAY